MKRSICIRGLGSASYPTNYMTHHSCTQVRTLQYDAPRGYAITFEYTFTGAPQSLNAYTPLFIDNMLVELNGGRNRGAVGHGCGNVLVRWRYE
jgi:hypothetical protein